jgi:hypothetical protein
MGSAVGRQSTVEDDRDRPDAAGAPSRRAPATPHARRPPRPRSPLLVAAIAYGLLFWMVLVVGMLIAWRLSGG